MEHRYPNAKIDIEVEVEPDSPVADAHGAVWFGAWLVIDCRRFGGSFASEQNDILEVPAFFEAIQLPGIYPLFTCTCGNFGCGGCWTEVIHTDEAWVMRNAYDPLRDPSIEPLADLLEEVFEVVVPWTVLSELATAITDKLEQTRTLYPGQLIFNGTLGTLLNDVHSLGRSEGLATQN